MRPLDVRQQLAKEDAIGLRQVPERDRRRRSAAFREAGVDDRAIADHGPESAAPRLADVVPQRGGHALKPRIELPEIREDLWPDQQAAGRRVGDQIRGRQFGKQPARKLVDRAVAARIQHRQAVVPCPPQPRRREPDHRILLQRAQHQPHGFATRFDAAQQHEQAAIGVGSGGHRALARLDRAWLDARRRRGHASGDRAQPVGGVERRYRGRQLEALRRAREVDEDVNRPHGPPWPASSGAGTGPPRRAGDADRKKRRTPSRAPGTRAWDRPVGR